MSSVSTLLRRALTPRATLALRYAAPAKGGKGKKGAAAADSGPAQIAKFDPTVCTGANYFTTGTDPVIKPDSEYPEWLFTLLDRKEYTDPLDKKYWQRRKKDEINKRNKLSAKR